MSGIAATTPDGFVFRQADTPNTRIQKLEILRLSSAALLSSFTLGFSITDLPTASAEPLFLYRVRGENWLFNAATCYAEALVGATGAPALRIFKDGAQVGTISFAGTVGTVAFSNASFPANSLFEIFPPAANDPTLDQVSVSLSVGIV